MRGEEFEIEAGSGKIRAKVAFDGFSLFLLTTHNGYQWSGANLSDDVLPLVEEVIAKYKARKGAEDE